MKLAVIVILTMLLGCHGDASVRPAPRKYSEENALVRGSQAPDRNGLYRAAIMYLITKCEKLTDTKPELVCVTVPWSAKSVSPYLVDPDPEVLQDLNNSYTRVVGGSRCTNDSNDVYWAIMFDRVDRWWDTSDEYEIKGSIMFPNIKAQIDEYRSFCLVAIHTREGWKIIREKEDAE